MRKLLTTFVCVWFTLAVWAGDGIYEKLQQIPQIFLLFSLNITFLYIFYFLSLSNITSVVSVVSLKESSIHKGFHCHRS